MYQDTTGAAAKQAARAQMNSAQPWSTEVSPANWSGQQMQGYETVMPGLPLNTMPGYQPGFQNIPAQPQQQAAAQPDDRSLQMDSGLSQDAIESPVTADEAYRGSLKALLAKNVGHYVVATFLIGTQSPVSWEGFLHSVGNDYLVIFQPDPGRYITGDYYALKFVEFHDTKGVVPSCPGYRRRDGQHIW